MQARQEGYCGQRGVLVEVYLLKTRQQDGGEWQPPSKVCLRVAYICATGCMFCSHMHSTLSLYEGRCDDFGCAYACVYA